MGSDRYFVGMLQEAAPIDPPSQKLPGISLPLMSMAASIVSFRAGGSKTRAISTKIYGISSTLFSYPFGLQNLPAVVRNIIHPVLICGGLTAILQVGFGKLCGLLPVEVLTNYFGSGVVGAGAGDVISSLLGPAVISFGLQLYLYREMLVNNAIRVLFTTVFSAMIGLYSSAMMAQKVGFATVEAAVSPLTRCITTPLALAGGKLTGADPSLTALFVVLSGVLGASCSETILSTLKIQDPLSVGLSTGASSHGIGTASLVNEPKKFASSVVSMTLTGLWTVCFLANPNIRAKLIDVASKEVLPVT